MIKIGIMFCPIVDSSPSVIGSSQPSQNDWAGLSPIPSCLKHHSDSTPKGILGGHHVNMDISVKRVFQNLKRDLLINTKAVSISSTAPPVCLLGGVSDRGEHLNYQPRLYSRVCYKCLDDGHVIRDCTKKLRCYYCFNYDHHAKFCAKRRFDLRHKWAPNPSKLLLVEKQLDKAAGASNPAIKSVIVHVFAEVQFHCTVLDQLPNC